MPLIAHGHRARRAAIARLVIFRYAADRQRLAIQESHQAAAARLPYDPLFQGLQQRQNAPAPQSA